MPVGDNRRCYHQKVEQKAQRRDVKAQQERSQHRLATDKFAQREGGRGEPGVGQIFADNHRSGLKAVDIITATGRRRHALIQDHMPGDGAHFGCQARLDMADVVAASGQQFLRQRLVGVAEPERRFGIRCLPKTGNDHGDGNGILPGSRQVKLIAGLNAQFCAQCGRHPHLQPFTGSAVVVQRRSVEGDMLGNVLKVDKIDIAQRAFVRVAGITGQRLQTQDATIGHHPDVAHGQPHFGRERAGNVIAQGLTTVNRQRHHARGR